MVRQALIGGAKVVQYRDKSNEHEKRWKQAEVLVQLCKEYGAVSIINDDIELAKVVNADGVHLGEADADIAEAKAILGDKKVIGISCYDDLSLAETAQSQGASYVAFGTMFASSTKPGNKLAGVKCIEEAKKLINISIVAIGGIDISNAETVVSAGADSIAVISALFGQDDIESTAQAFSDLYKTNS